LGLFSASQAYLLSFAKEEPMTFAQAFVWRFVPWQLWALAAPAIVELGRRVPFSRRRIVLPLVLHAAFYGALAIGYELLGYACGRLAGQAPFVEYSARELLPPFLIKSAVFDLFVYAGLLVVDTTLGLKRRYRMAALERAQLEARLAEAQLHALKMQLHPHFLFNTMNTIATLIRKSDSPGALKTLSGLSDLLRHSLASVDKEFVSMREELDFLRRYLDIETTRFSDRLKVVVDVEERLLDARVPNLILQPLVENALKHGLAPKASGGQLEIAARAADAGRLRIEVRDDGLGLAPARGHAGVGLTHVRERLAQLYPGQHTFALAPREPRGAIATVEIPLSTERASCAS
jgi:signal transduction histidine kinase